MRQVILSLNEYVCMYVTPGAESAVYDYFVFSCRCVGEYS